MLRPITVALGCVICTLAVSQTATQPTSGPYTQHTAAEIEQRVQSLTEKARRSPAGFSAETWERYGDHYAMLALRLRNGGGEVHVHTGDYFYVLRGHATEMVGGVLQDGKETDPGELRGSSVQNGTPHEMGPGDFIHIAANTPHQTIMGSEPFVYLVIKAAE